MDDNGNELKGRVQANAGGVVALTIWVVGWVAVWAIAAQACTGALW